MSTKIENFDFGMQPNQIPGAAFVVLGTIFAVLSFPGVKSGKYSFCDAHYEKS